MSEPTIGEEGIEQHMESITHDPAVKGSRVSSWVICRECGATGSEQPTEYGPGVLKLCTSRANANRIAREHRMEHNL